MNSLADRAKALLGRVDLHEKYQLVFSSPEGQEVLDHICEQAYVFRSTASESPHEMALREGSRRLALAILRHAYRDHGEIQKRVNNQIQRLHEATT